MAQCNPDKHLGLGAWNSADALLCIDTLFVLDTYFYPLVSEVEQARGEVLKYARGLEEKVVARTRELEGLSRRDSLTGLYNHRAFTEFLRRDLALAISNSSPLCLIYSDIDDFKNINDRLGHREGDQVLRHLGRVLATVSRESDVPCRYGGDEFCVILPNTFEAQATVYCRRIMTTLTDEKADVTLSIGIAQSGPGEHAEMDTLIRKADDLMYSAKESGGNRLAAVRP